MGGSWPGRVALYRRNPGSLLPEWWLSNSGTVAQFSPEYSRVVEGLSRILVDELSLYQQLGALPPTEEIIKSYNESQK